LFFTPMTLTIKRAITTTSIAINNDNNYKLSITMPTTPTTPTKSSTTTTTTINN
jgi:hypothetical protein